MNNKAISIEHVSKQYKLGTINTGTFFRDFQSYLARKQGKPDPHLKIGDTYENTDDYFWALQNLNCFIQEGDRVGIIGRNGAGKSTLLKLISRISAPTEGQIKIKGRVASLLEVGTGFHKELTGRENIFLNGSILGMKKKNIERKLDEIIDFSGIEKHIDTPVKRYSSGMYVRLGFAVAAHLDSEILIADEVLAVGDAKFQKKAIGKMNEISTNQGRTVLFVSHNMQAVQALCNKGIILQKGRLVLDGDIDECVSAYNTTQEVNKLREWRGSVGDMNLQMTEANIKEEPNGLRLHISYNIDNPKLDYVFSIIINNVEGQRLCVCTASDYFQDSDYDAMREQGVHSLSLFLDTTLFSTGQYFIEFDFAIHNLKRIVNQDIKLYFEVFDERNHRHSSPCRENIVDPNWDWELIE